MSDAARLAEELGKAMDGLEDHQVLFLSAEKARSILAALRAPAPMPEGGAEPVAIVAVTFAGIDGREEMGVNWTGTELPDEGAPLYSATALQAARREALQEAVQVCRERAKSKDRISSVVYALLGAADAIRALPGAK